MRLRHSRLWSLLLLAELISCLARPLIAQQNAPPAASSLVTPQTLNWQGELNHRFLASHGKRGFLFAIGPEGVEGYLYPFRIFHDLRVSFRLSGSDQVIAGPSCAKTALVTPSTITRSYAAEGLAVRETLFVPLDQPVLVITYEVESSQPVDIDVALRPDMDLMWPGGIGGQTYSWDDTHNTFLIEEPSGRYYVRIGSPETISHSDPTDRSHPWITDKVLSLSLHARPHEVVPIVATISLPRQEDTLDLYRTALNKYPAWMQKAESHYRGLLDQRLQIVTGDPQTDNALAWATIALDQAEGCNPDLGCGLLAGYGPTWDTRRPQYAWFFAGDALVTSWALEAEGAHDETLRALDFIRKYQNRETGAIWHEISQSASYVDWFHLYPYIYRHTDISPLYLLALHNIWKSTGDRSLLDASWPSLQAAWRFCLAHVDSKDGLMVIPPDQSGVNENEADRTEKELPLELAWAAGADAFSNLAAAAGHSSESAQARAASDRAKGSLEEFWDPVRNYYFEGLTANGRPLAQQMASPAWGVSQGLLPPAKRDLVLARLAQPAFKTPWGLRSIPSDDPAYQPNSYAHGSVWPAASATYILATLAAHEPKQAWQMWKSLVGDSFIGSPGHIPEVLSGDSYTPLDVSVPEQTWSSAALTTATVRGILGFDPDVPAKALRFEPHLPPEVHSLTIRNFSLGSRMVEFTLSTSPERLELSVVNSGEPFELQFVPEVYFSGALLRASLNGRALPVRLDTEKHDKHAAVSFTVNQRETLTISAQVHAQ